jgi:branched-chain amino acid transport system permease protein
MNRAKELAIEPEQTPAASVAPTAKRRNWKTPSTVLAVIIILGLLPIRLAGSYYMHILILAFIYCVISSAFRAISISGQFNIAQGAYMGIGAYVGGMCSVWLHFPPIADIILGSIAATVVGVVLAYPFARLRTVYYAMGTLFLGYVVINIFTAGGKTTGSSTGLAGVKPLFESRTTYYYVILALMIVSLACLYRFEFSRIGVTLKAVAQSHMVASSVGISEIRARILAVGFGSFFTGLMGAVYAHYQMVASPNSFGLSATLWIIMYVLVGGINSFWGPSVGVLILLIIPEFFRDLKGYLPFFTSAILLIIAFTMPDGIVGLLKLVRNKLVHLIRKEPPAEELAQGQEVSRDA